MSDTREFLSQDPTAEIEQLKQLLAELIFAYINKDEDSPHNFEIATVSNALRWARHPKLDGFLRRMRAEYFPVEVGE